MPTVPQQQTCAELCCNNPRTLTVYCLHHGGRDTVSRYTAPTQERRKSNAQYSTRHWQQIRLTQLSKQPICQSCLSRNIVTQAHHVDHVFPWQQIGKGAFYINLFQSLCASCHSTKTTLEAKGIYRYYHSTQHKDYFRNDYERVASLIIK